MGNSDSKLSGPCREQLGRLAAPQPEPAFVQNEGHESTTINPFYLGVVAAAERERLDPRVLKYCAVRNPTNFSNFVLVNAAIVVEATRGKEFSSVVRSLRLLRNTLPTYFQQLAGSPSGDILWLAEVPGGGEEGYAPQLINSLLELAMCPEFTLSAQQLWECGINTLNSQPPTPLNNPRIDSHRLEIVNLLLVLVSQDIYTQGPSQNRYWQYLTQGARIPDEFHISIVNVACAGGRSRDPDAGSVTEHDTHGDGYSRQQYAQLRQELSNSCLQLVNVFLLPGGGPPHFYTQFLHTEHDLKYFVSAFIKVFKWAVNKAIENETNLLQLSSAKDQSYRNKPSQTDNSHHQPQQQKGSTENGNSLSLPEVHPQLPQFLLLITNLLPLNKPFENYFEDKFANKFMVFALYYIKYYDHIPQYSAQLVPLCYTLMLTLSRQNLVRYKLLANFNGNYYTNNLPNFFKLPNFNNSMNTLNFRDFLIIQWSQLATQLIKRNLIPNKFITEIIYNILLTNLEINKDKDFLPPLSSTNKISDTLSYSATISLLNLLSKMSSKSYVSTFGNNPIYVNGAQYFPSIQSLSSPAWKLDQLALLLRSLACYMVLYYKQAGNLIFLLSRHQNLLAQVRDSLNYITRLGNGNVKINEFIFNRPNEHPSLTIQEVIPHQDHQEYSNSDDLDGNYLVFDSSKLAESQDVDEQAESLSSNRGSIDARSNSELSTTQQQQLQQQQQNAGANTSTTGQDSNKTFEVYEHSDYGYDLFLDNEYLYTRLRTKWPTGLTETSKLKAPKGVSFINQWTGAPSLRLLIRITKLFSAEFPQISATTKNADYAELMNQFMQYEDTFHKRIAPYLTAFLQQQYQVKPIEFPLEPGVYHRWLHRLCWSNIFNMHSWPYTNKVGDSVAPDTAALSNPNALSESKTASPLLPSLERWASNGSNLTRTQSNGSSILNYFTQDNNNNTESYNTSVTQTGPNSNNGNNNNNTNDAKNHSRDGDSSYSFLRFPWGGFNRHHGTESPIKEGEESEYGTAAIENVPQNSQGNFTIDMNLVKENLWAGTDVKLFPLRRDEREEFSFMDMTSSLFRKLRLSSGSSLESTPPQSQSPQQQNGRQYNQPLSIPLSAARRFY
ncbi:Ecm30p KNAG_0B06410 [Huiozyma naganishii CBS 8797]|uniref:Protein HID1 n=1 Tax=Huiozyma naganishii (strain ATCC MYA-139 / BCRC 22969 / CBS 8797 / KCTC 17520 / NBRC 10181 / NCYC 3082 / Yp74L-3) TaxID=1071383 RepID=J7S440_HUIN7|nr:hypothetical protein KNAG_0B06410 [Kazachstania naganishii CBS 8797]CCK69069.1 hypothetical protein KNAG_0B06410 [Kazachstania naganishii CBS 8797]